MANSKGDIKKELSKIQESLNRMGKELKTEDGKQALEKIGTEIDIIRVSEQYAGEVVRA